MTDSGVRVNDFSLVIATVNGSGSMTANQILYRAMFGMGVPVSSKNLFPSNIQGLPTWFMIRVSAAGYLARKDASEVLVAVNADTFLEDIRRQPAGSDILYDAAFELGEPRGDCDYYPIPITAWSREQIQDAKLRTRLKNMFYLGVIAWLYGVDPAYIHAELEATFPNKPKVVAANQALIDSAFAWAETTYPARSRRFRIEAHERARATGQIILDGNEAAAIGAVFGGVQFAAWYPITPSSSLMEDVIRHSEKLRRTPEGKNAVAIVQAEDELAAIGMVIGAGWAGARSMTATSGPGVSLMGEFASLAYYTEVPSVLWNVQRVGPSTGLPTRTQQGDVTLCYTLGHGDTQHPCLFPSTMQECFDFARVAFDLAERLQTLVLVLSDLDLGMNLWASPPFTDARPSFDRGKVTRNSLPEHWGRYRDLDGDGIGLRTLPGNQSAEAVWFARGSGHNADAKYSEDATVYRANMARIAKKLEVARSLAPAPVDEGNGLRQGHGTKAEIGLIAFGTSHDAVQEAQDRLAQAHNLPTEYLRLRALPASDAVREFIATHARTYVIEQNRDGQLAAILRDEYPDLAPRIRAAAVSDGLPLAAGQVVELLLNAEHDSPVPPEGRPIEGRPVEGRLIEGRHHG